MIGRERAEEILKGINVLQEGHFLLTSGRHTNKYIHCARILEYPEFTSELSSIIFKAFKDDKIDVVIGPAIGGVIFAYEVARQLGVKNLFAERKNGRMVLRRGFSIPKGARVLIAEDIITTGESIREVMDIIEEQGAELVGVAVLIDRSNGKTDFGCKLQAAYTTEVVSYEPDECPICKIDNIPLIKAESMK